MKIQPILIMSLTAAIGLSSCEMKQELWGGKDDVATGTLQLGVTIKAPASLTRAGGGSAENGTIDVSRIDTDQYPISIAGVGGEWNNGDVRHDYDALKDMPAELRLPVGKYNISAHTPGECLKRMEQPYFAGSTPMTIDNGMGTHASVICKMKNSQIMLSYGQDFLDAFTEWTITLDDGSNTVLSFTQREGERGTTPIYWLFDEQSVSSITMNVRAKTAAGNSVGLSQSYKKEMVEGGLPEGESEFYGGGDALHFNLGAVEATEGYVTGISINTTIAFENKEDVVEIPTDEPNPEPNPEPEPDPDEPDTPTEGDLSVVYEVNGHDLFAEGVTYSFSQGIDETLPLSTSSIAITCPAKLQDMFVTIVAGNEGFDGIVVEMKFTDRNLVGADGNGDTALGELLAGVGVDAPMPKRGDTSYQFPIGAFYSLMNIYEATTGDNDGIDYHTFKIKVTDQAGAEKEVSLKVTINP